MVRTIVFIIWLEFEVKQLICFHLDHLDIVQCHCTPKQCILINHRIKRTIVRTKPTPTLPCYTILCSIFLASPRFSGQIQANSRQRGRKKRLMNSLADKSRQDSFRPGLYRCQICRILKWSGRGGGGGDSWKFKGRAQPCNTLVLKPTYTKVILSLQSLFVKH